MGHLLVSFTRFLLPFHFFSFFFFFFFFRVLNHRDSQYRSASMKIIVMFVLLCLVLQASAYNPITPEIKAYRKCMDDCIADIRKKCEKEKKGGQVNGCIWSKTKRECEKKKMRKSKSQKTAGDEESTTSMKSAKGKALRKSESFEQSHGR